MNALTILAALIVRYYLDERNDIYRVTSMRLHKSNRYAYVRISTGQPYWAAFDAIFWACTDFTYLDSMEHIRTLRSGRELYECGVYLGY
jgi:hypothetical protein